MSFLLCSGEFSNPAKSSTQAALKDLDDVMLMRLLEGSSKREDVGKLAVRPVLD